MTRLLAYATVVAADPIPISPKPPPGSDLLINIVNWLSWMVMLAGIGALIYAGGRFGWERWHGGALESPKIVLGALIGGVIATSAGSIMSQVITH
ncbi:hypothetical protein BJY24_005787 [Nocardia transvalensis]|uniref:Uncharacterized protein n=1 Tax=Nocardia transvalensis TaxID=37333 RepID=A0A7W9ULM5_9NOCA|nr:hypothetical protein [Nocardia transvalensis]MBB5916875.1 hypothetical protein [Nocardia transvalensis]